ncbi:hypothetical protein [Marinobacter phage PS6]|nr:hypothetical protein [Marinobacter phage PS6]
MNSEYVKSRVIAAKIERLANMKASYKFRLSAITAADNRPGKVW